MILAALLQLAGMAAAVVAGFLMVPAVGLFVLGVCLFAVGFDLERKR